MAVTATHLSAGIYSVNGQQIKAPTSAAAIAAYTAKFGNTAPKNPPTVSTGSTTTTPPVSGGVTVIGTSSDGIQHLSDGTYRDSKTGNILPGAQSLGQARTVIAKGGDVPPVQAPPPQNSDVSPQNPGGAPTQSVPVVDPVPGVPGGQAGGQPNVPATVTTPASTTGNQVPDAVNDVKKIDFSNPNSAIAGEVKTNADIVTQNDIQNNPTINSDAGDHTVARNADGSFTVTDQRTGQNKQLYDQQLGTGTLGAKVAGDIVGKAGTFDPNAAQKEHAMPTINQDYIDKYQKAAYDNLTQGLQDQRTQSVNDKMQELNNRGVGQGTDEYEKEMKRVTDEYDQRDATARNSAYASGLSAANTYGNLGISAFTAGVNGANSSQTTAANSASTLNGLTQSAAPTTQTFAGNSQSQIDTGSTFGQVVSNKLGEDTLKSNQEIAKIQAKKSGSSSGSSGVNFVG